MLNSNLSYFLIDSRVRDFLSETTGYTDYRYTAVEALGRIETVDSVNAVTEVALSKEEKERDPLATLATALVYQIHDSTEAASVRESCRTLMQQRKRVRPPGAILD